MPYKNYMEDAVLDEILGVLDQLEGFCGCERCREDMVAWTLNQLPSKYVTTVLGAAYTKFNQLQAQSRADIVVTLMNAAKVVKANPRH